MRRVLLLLGDRSEMFINLYSFRQNLSIGIYCASRGFGHVTVTGIPVQHSLAFLAPAGLTVSRQGSNPVTA